MTVVAPSRPERRRRRSASSRRLLLVTYLRDRPGLRWALLCVGVIVVFFVAMAALAAVRLRSVAGDLRAARDTLQRVQVELENGQLGAARQDLAVSQARLNRATGNLYAALPFDFVDWVPVVSQNLRSLRHSVGLAYTIVSGGSSVLADASSLQGPTGKLEVSLTQGGVPLDVLTRASAGLAVLANELPTPNQRPSTALLLGPVARMQNEVFDEAAGRRSQVVNLARAIDLLDDMAGANGPRRYLIAVANTAEERGSGGMILAYGELDSGRGQFTLGSFGGVDDIPVSKAPASTLPADYRARWDGFSFLTNWRQANLGADFPTLAPTLVSMYNEVTNLPVDGVIQIDPAGLAAILKGIGPVDVPGVGTVTADNVVDITLHQAYLDHPDRSERQDVSADVAKAVFHQLLSGTYTSLRPLATALADAVAGRHLQMWTSHAAAQSDVVFFDADGALPTPGAPAFSLVVQNTSQNKLDYYLDTSLGLSGSRPATANGRLDATVTLQNTAPPDGTNKEVFGPNGAGQQRGWYRGIVSLYVPTSTNLVGVDGDATVSDPSVFTEGGHEVISYEVALPPGGRSHVVLHLGLLPRGNAPPLVLLVPQPRVRPTNAIVDVDFGGQQVRRSLQLDRSYLLAPGTPPLLASGPTGIRVFTTDEQ
jgi:hypothetical protein